LMIFQSESLKQGIDADAHLTSTDDLEITPFKEFMYLPVRRTMMRMSQQHDLFARIDWPAPMIGMSFDYIAKPELLEAPHMKKILEEDRLLCELFHEVCLMNIAKKSTLLPAFRDVFTDALYPVWKEGKVSVRSVFAARVHLDILDSCPDFNGKQVLQEEGRRQLDYFGIYYDSEGGLDMRSELRWSVDNEPLLREYHLRIQCHLIDPTFGEFKRKLLKTFDENDAKLPKQRMLTEEETENAPSNMVIFTNRNLSHISKNNAIQQKLSSSLKP
jgi:hypothetical protein